jgi:arylsulfatase
LAAVACFCGVVVCGLGAAGTAQEWPDRSELPLTLSPFKGEIAAALDFMERKTAEGVPWFTYVNPTRMHVWTHLKPASDGVTGLGTYPDGMVELDGYVGQLLQKVEELGIADNTIVLFTTDNGAEVNTWPDGGTTPFRGEKATNWEGGFRVPMLVRWPGVIEPGTVINDMGAHEDLIPTFAAAAGEPDLVEKVLAGYQAGDKTFKVHLDGYNLIPFLKGEAPNPRNMFIYWSDDGDLVAIRYGNWKAVFKEQEHTGLEVWQRDFTNLRVPKLFNLRADPYERGPESIYYDKWIVDRAFVQVPMQALAAEWLSSFREFPPRQKPASFNLDSVMRQMSEVPAKP